MRNLRNCAIGIVIATSSLSSISWAQSKSAGASKSPYKIISVSNANVMTTKECLGLKVVMALVSRRATREVIERSSRSIASGYAREFDLTVLFFTSREAATKFRDGDSEMEEARLLRFVRGLYSRSSAGSFERIKFFPAGLTESDLDDFESTGGN